MVRFGKKSNKGSVHEKSSRVSLFHLDSKSDFQKISISPDSTNLGLPTESLACNTLRQNGPFYITVNNGQQSELFTVRASFFHLKQMRVYYEVKR